MADFQDDLQLLEQAARHAGALAMQWYQTDMDVRDKGGNHPVTEADLAVDRYLYEKLRKERPDYGWLSEETVDDQSRLSAKRTFLVDPIDGTRAFIRGEPYFSVSLAIVEDGQPIVGVVFNPARRRLYSAARGQGAQCDGAPIHVSQCTELAHCTMIAQKSLFRWREWKRKWPEMNVQPRNSMAWRMALVASGHADGTFTIRPKSDWDLAAADLIAREAGAIVTDPFGHELRYNRASTRKPGVICAGKRLHALIEERIEETERFQKDR